MKFSPTLAIKLSKEIVEEGRSVYSVLRKYPILDEKELRLWSALYREHGEEVFMSNQEFPITLRRKIVEDKIGNGLSLIQTCVKYKILHRSNLRNWLRSYKSGNLMKQGSKKGKNITSSSSEAERIRQLEEELLLVKAENAYLKKLRALMRRDKKG